MSWDNGMDTTGNYSIADIGTPDYTLKTEMIGPLNPIDNFIVTNILPNTFPLRCRFYKRPKVEKEYTILDCFIDVLKTYKGRR